MNKFLVVPCVVISAGGMASSALASDPWADAVVHYDPGSAAGDYTTAPSSTLGAPERFTGEIGGFPAAVNPFNPPWGWDELLAIGAGGSLTLRFDEPIVDDPMNPYGLDLILFSNTGYASDLGYGVTSGSTLGGGGVALIEVSQNGEAWTPLATVLTAQIFPTLGYQDIDDPFSPPAGSVPTDFTLPLDPAFDPSGLSLEQIIAAYAGSGGGLGLDLSTTGLGWATYVRISALSGTVTIDAVSDVRAVPAPGAAAAVGAGALLAARRRRRPS